MSPELKLAIISLIVMVLGAVAPSLWSAITLRVIMRQYPPHRHVGDSIIYPRGYDPGAIENRRRART